MPVGMAFPSSDYSYKELPVLGGDYTIDNSYVLPIAVHYGAWGSIYDQISDLPNGTRVEIRVKK